MAYGLPVERRNGPRLVGDEMRREFPLCLLTDSVGMARQAAYEMGMDVCPVLDEEGVVLGLCTRASLHAHPSINVELVMDPGPTTVRPSMPVAKAFKLMERDKIPLLLVTTPEGKLLGFFNHRGGAEAAVGSAP